MKYYIATASGNREAALAAAANFRSAGHRVVSTWHDSPYDRKSESRVMPGILRSIAEKCMQEIDYCDCVLALGHPDMRGALWECGYALGKGKRVYWGGSREVSLFAWLSE